MFDISIAGAFGAGVLSFLSPCVLPLVPPYLCFLAGVGVGELGAAEAPRRWRIIGMAAAFVLGFSTVFVALGASVSSVGVLVTRHFESLSIVAGAVILLLGMHFLGWLRLGVLYRDIRFHAAARPAGLLGGYVVGLAFAFGWTPCVGPVLATVLMVAGAEASAAQGALLLGAYALGIGVPFLLAAVFAGPFLALLARFRRYAGVVEKVIGASLVVTGVLFMTGGMPVIAGWLLQAVPLLGRIG